MLRVTRTRSIDHRELRRIQLSYARERVDLLALAHGDEVMVEARKVLARGGDAVAIAEAIRRAGFHI